MDYHYAFFISENKKKKGIKKKKKNCQDTMVGRLIQ